MFTLAFPRTLGVPKVKSSKGWWRGLRKIEGLEKHVAVSSRETNTYQIGCSINTDLFDECFSDSK